MIITLEGLDNCGKNTIADLLIMRHPEYQKIDFPDYTTPFGQFIRTQLSSNTLSPISLQLLFSSERLSKCNLIAEKSKDNVILKN